MEFISRLLFGVLFTTLSAGTIAGEIPYDKKTLDHWRSADRPVVVHVHARWCGTCKKQAAIVAPLLADPEFKNLTLMKVDYDKEKALLKSLNIANQSTFVAFKGSTEVGRSTGDTNEESIAALLRKAS
jgi:thioredoxin 1